MGYTKSPHIRLATPIPGPTSRPPETTAAPDRDTAHGETSPFPLDKRRAISAWLRDGDGSWVAHLKVEQWYGDYQREPVVAWVVSWLDPNAETPEMLTAAIESPARTADDPERQQHLVELANHARQSPPVTPVPFAVPPPTPGSPEEWSGHFDLQFHSWESAFGELEQAAKASGPAAEADRYRYLTQTLDWIYAMDSSLQLQWKKLGLPASM